MDLWLSCCGWLCCRGGLWHPVRSLSLRLLCVASDQTLPTCSSSELRTLMAWVCQATSRPPFERKVRFFCVFYLWYCIFLPTHAGLCVVLPYRPTVFLFLSYPFLSYPTVFCNHPLIYAAPALLNELPLDLHQFAYPPLSSVSLTSPCPLSCSFWLTTENQALQAILSWFLLLWHTMTSAIVTIAPCCVLDLTSPDPDLALKWTKQPECCRLNLI